MREQSLEQAENYHYELTCQMFAATGDDYHRLNDARRESWQLIQKLRKESQGAK